MDALETCVFCKQKVAASTTEMTGHGTRCFPCSQKASLALLEGKSQMGDHLTVPELDNVIVRCKAEIFSGTGIAIAGLCAMFGSVVIGFIVTASGLGILLHGVSTRKQAIEAKKSFPSAQIVSD